MMVEDSFTYPVSFNGKMRFTIDLPASCSQDEAIAAVRQTPEFQKWTNGNEPKKVIFVPKRIINIVC